MVMVMVIEGRGRRAAEYGELWYCTYGMVQYHTTVRAPTRHFFLLRRV